MAKRNLRSIIIAIVIIGLIVLLWDQLNDFGAELYRFFN